VLHDKDIKAAALLDHMPAIAKMESIRGILNCGHELLFSFGAVRTSYHFTPPFASQKGKHVYISTTNFPDAWMELYRNPDFRLNDPVSDYIMQRGEIMIVEDAIAEQSLQDGQLDFVEKLRSMRLNHAFGVPLFGPNGRNAYATVGFDRPLHAEQDMYLSSLVMASSNACFRRINQLIIKRMRQEVTLSIREQEVLNAMCAGLSNRQIAEKSGIAPATVDTYVRRLFFKLDVNDRTSAILKALTLGLTTLNTSHNY
jgi:DNA-binding CsgD family transcriptional regulator